ncbi:MAG TPA: hypothetical protein VMI54_28145 [Polyangiaceae bacterium]|nr:hypothetical protein [Polyangiaceae bacterium]
MSRLKFSIVRYTLLAYVLLTLWEVLGHREDFPLSSFPMFAQARGFPGRASRTVLVGVNEHGETTLNPQALSDLMSAVRLQKIFQGLQTKSDAEQADFMARVAGILSDKKDEDDRFWGVRFYTENWKTQLHLKGIDHPSRELEFAAYVPPERLKRDLANDAKTGAPSEAPRPLPSGDLLVELDADACAEACSVTSDPLASGGTALALARGGSLHVGVPAGSYTLFVRMRSKAPPGDDRLLVSVDGKRVKEAKDGVGNYKHQLPFDVWVWASLEPGWPALRLRTKGDPSELSLTADRADVEVDQIWLAKSRKELPLFNAPLERQKAGGE